LDVENAFGDKKGGEMGWGGVEGRVLVKELDLLPT
jgi:hypothetical protein